MRTGFCWLMMPLIWPIASNVAKKFLEWGRVRKKKLKFFKVIFQNLTIFSKKIGPFFNFLRFCNISGIFGYFRVLLEYCFLIWQILFCSNSEIRADNAQGYDIDEHYFEELRDGLKYAVFMSYIDIYNEQIFDLLEGRVAKI